VRLTAQDLRDLGVVLGSQRRKLLDAMALLGGAQSRVQLTFRSRYPVVRSRLRGAIGLAARLDARHHVRFGLVDQLVGQALEPARQRPRLLPWTVTRLTVPPLTVPPSCEVCGARSAPNGELPSDHHADV
jgi:hypothetical protein